MRICTVIPTYNESATIGEVVHQIREQNLEVVVVDDDSNDETVKISQDYGSKVLRNSRNEGKGFSLIRGLQYALENDFDAVITIDGDGQHRPEDIPLFIRKAESSGASIVIGNRMHNPHRMPMPRILTNKFMSWFISKLIKQRIPDTQCGFRFFRRQLLDKVKFTTKRFETESEILFQASYLGYKIESVEIESIYHKEKSQINPILDTIRFINFIWRQIWITRF